MPDANISEVYQQSEVPCRTCTDFKTWAKKQRDALTTKKGTSSDTMSKFAKSVTEEERIANCPLDKDELGRSTWKLLHTIAANYPEKPTIDQAKNMKTFFSVFSKIYPCEYCAKDFQEEIKIEPPDVSNQTNMAQWLCRLHNRVNLKIGKEQFDCSKVDERWRTGWKDGSCD